MSLHTGHSTVKVTSSIPSLFICPLSSNLMQDPVTLCTGQTYDRRNIEKWFDEGYYTCPSTMQRLSTLDVVPNYHLRRRIYDWSVSNYRARVTRPSEANETIPSPGISELHLKMMFTDLPESRNGSIKILKQPSAMAKLSHSDSKLLWKAGNIDALWNSLFTSVNMINSIACEEALSLLVLLPVDSLSNKIAIRPKNLKVLSWLLSKGDLNARVNVALLLARLASKETTNDRDRDLKLSIGATGRVFEGLVELLNETQRRAVEAASKACLSLLKIERNVVKAVEAGLAFTIIELLVKWTSRNLQSLFTLLEYVCSIPKGLAVLSTHSLTIPVLASFVIQRESNRTTQKSITSLWTLCNQSGRNGERCRDDARAQEGLLEHLLYISRQDRLNGNSKVTERATYIRALLWCRSTDHFQARE